METCGAASAWESVLDGFERWGAVVLLALSTLMAVFDPSLGADDRLTVVGLVVVAAAWVLLGDALAPARVRDHPWHPAVHLTGMLALAALLMDRQVVFFMFAIMGYFHAGRLRPRGVVYVGVAAASLTINWFTWGKLADASTEAVLGFVALTVLQTLLIGSGVLGTEHVRELSEQRRQTVRQLEATLAENEGLHAQLVVQAREAGVHDERQRLARDIHDTLAQGFTGIITQLEAARHTEDGPALSRHLQVATDLARRSLDEARRSVQALGPGALERAGIDEALRELATHWGSVYGLPVDVSADAGATPLPARVEAALLGVAQEALSNAARHAAAGRVAVTLALLDDEAVLDVRDDGRGFAGTAPPVNGTGFGLTTMRQRVEGAGGRLTIESAPGTGTAVCAQVPLGAHDG